MGFPRQVFVFVFCRDLSGLRYPRMISVHQKRKKKGFTNGPWPLFWAAGDLRQSMLAVSGPTQIYSCFFPSRAGCGYTDSHCSVRYRLRATGRRRRRAAAGGRGHQRRHLRRARRPLHFHRHPKRRRVEEAGAEVEESPGVVAGLVREVVLVAFHGVVRHRVLRRASSRRRTSRLIDRYRSKGNASTITVQVYMFTFFVSFSAFSS